MSIIENFEHPSNFSYGIVDDNGSVAAFPVKSQAKYDLVDVHLLARLVQTYTVNVSARASFVFPLPPDAAICSFKAIIDGTRVIEGVLREKEQAKQEYETAILQGKFGALFQQYNTEIFRISLGNVNPGQVIEIQIRFCSSVDNDGGFESLRLTFPTAIAPRYGAGFSGHSLTQDQNFLDFSLAIQLSSPIKSISSISHPIAVKIGDHIPGNSSVSFDVAKAYVTLSSNAPLEKDIVIVVSGAGLDKPRCFVEVAAQESTRAYALTLVPRFQLPLLLEQEYVFLVDRSGSMEGGKMAAVRSALQIMIKSLPLAGTTFNIVSFGTKHSLLWPSSIPYAQGSVKMAGEYIDKMEADFGGTKIQSALEAVFNCWSNPRLPLTVFMLTDGLAHNSDGVKTAIRGAITQAKMVQGLLRVFCMGIGDQISKAMCEDIARTGNGCAVFVGEMEPPHEKLMSLLRAARSAPVEDLTIDWSNGQGVVGSNIEQAPSSESLRPFYPQFRTSIFAIVDISVQVANEVRISGVAQGHPVGLSVPITILETSAEPANSKKLLHTLAARALIQRYEDFYEKEETNSDKLVLRPSKENILRVALHYGIVSSMTSFVAIDESSKTMLEAEIRKPEPEPQNPGPFSGFSYSSSSSDSGFGAFGSPAQNMSFSAAKDLDTISKPSGKSIIEILARHQSFDGSFDGAPGLYKAILEDSNAPELPEDFGLSDKLKQTLWITTLCVIYLENKLAEEMVVWDLMVNKAREWVDNVLSQLIEPERLESSKKAIYELAKKKLQLR